MDASNPPAVSNSAGADAALTRPDGPNADLQADVPEGQSELEAERHYRSLFPITLSSVYLNHAAVAPLSTAARRAMDWLVGDVHENGAANWTLWLETYEAARRAFAVLIGAQPADVALLKNTSEGIATVAQGLDWRPGDRVVTVASEFPANIYPWLALRSRGVQVDAVPERGGHLDLEELRQHCRGARLLAISFVQYLSGYRLDLDVAGAICRETGTLLFVDAIQGLGAFEVNVARHGIHFLAADGHKWLTGPEGAAIFYVSPDVLDQVKPHEIGWLSIERWSDFEVAERALRASSAAAHKDTPASATAVEAAGASPAGAASLAPGVAWRKGAARFESGTLNTVGIYGLKAAVEMLQFIGTTAISRRVLANAGRLERELLARGCDVLGCGAPTKPTASVAGSSRPPSGPRPDAIRSGIVSFRHPQFGRVGPGGALSSDTIVRELAARRISCASRNGWIRCSPHFYNNADDIEAFVVALDEIVKLSR
jgi:cysteine desulfurase/selenocysteine lyase